MIRNYLKVALRNLIRYKIYSVTNILGLAVGMSAFILIALLLDHEESFDRFHSNFDEIYRVQQLVEYNDDTQEWTQTAFPLELEFRENYPEFKKTTVYKEVWGEYLSSSDDIKFYEEKGCYAQSSFF